LDTVASSQIVAMLDWNLSRIPMPVLES